jgi:hypothetical protein
MKNHWIGGYVSLLFILTCCTDMIPTRAFLPIARTIQSLKVGVQFSTTPVGSGPNTSIVDVCKEKIQAALDASFVKVTGKMYDEKHDLIECGAVTPVVCGPKVLPILPCHIQTLAMTNDSFHPRRLRRPEWLTHLH